MIPSVEMSLKQKYKSKLLPIKRSLNSLFNLDVIKYPNQEFAKKVRLCSYLEIDLLLDVGANIGQFASEMRHSGYKGMIFSFEPVQESFEKLKKYASKDSKWEVFPFALGDENGTAEIQVSQNSVSSSLLEANETLNQLDAETSTVRKEKIVIKTLDSLFKEQPLEGKRIFLKMDTQGSEDKVLAGAGGVLEKLILIQMEMPLIKTYIGGKDFYELDEYMRKNNYTLVSIDSGYFDRKTGRSIEVDGIYQNNLFN